MNSTGFLTRIRTKAARSVSQANINATILRNEPIDLPGDVGVQSKLANTFLQLSSQTKRLQAFYDQKMLALARLKQAILEKAFSGELAEPPSRAISEAAE